LRDYHQPPFFVVWLSFFFDGKNLIDLIL
jgi:hypothetical protein